MSDNEGLRRAAEAARECDCGTFDEGHDGDCAMFESSLRMKVSPDVVLGLLDEIDRLEAALLGGDREAYDDAERAEERAEIAEAKLARVREVIDSQSRREDIRTRVRAALAATTIIEERA